jgi:dolichyl-phosphate-mannose-protein mannosyltransferase
MGRRNIVACILLLLILGSLTRGILFGYPSEVVFDEFHFGKFIKAYQTGEYFFDIHPPLGRLLIVGLANSTGTKIDEGFGAIGEKIAPEHIWVLRIIPVLAGILLPVIIFGLCLVLGLSVSGSLLAALLMIFENSLLVQARFMLFDEMLLSFGFGALLLYWLSRRRQSTWLFAAAAIAAGCALSIKWTGLSFAGLIGLCELYRVAQKRINVKKFFIHCVILVIGAALVYITSFAIHFALLTKPGEGDAFMTQGFLEKSFWGKFTELNHVMLSANSQDLTHQYGSKWYTWPLMKRPIFYWQHIDDTGEARIYFLGNPIVYWGGSVAVLILLFGALNRRELFLTRKNYFILLGFFANLLPFIFIGRVMFLYHYLSALVFSIIALVYLIDKIKRPDIKLIVSGLLLLLSITGFIFFAPLSYGIHLSKDQLHTRFWFSTWE